MSLGETQPGPEACAGCVRQAHAGLWECRLSERQPCHRYNSAEVSCALLPRLSSIETQALPLSQAPGAPVRPTAFRPNRMLDTPPSTVPGLAGPRASLGFPGRRLEQNTGGLKAPSASLRSLVFFPWEASRKPHGSPHSETPPEAGSVPCGTFEGRASLWALQGRGPFHAQREGGSESGDKVARVRGTRRGRRWARVVSWPGHGLAFRFVFK